jgi:hypothetical protein
MIIETGGERWREYGPQIKRAVIRAFRRRAPKRPGKITRVKVAGKPFLYISTKECLKRAGYKVIDACR